MKIEILEARIAPATVLSFTDVDGDSVALTVSVGDLSGTAAFVPVGVGQQLVLLDLSDPQFAGADFTASVKRGVNGDGLVNIGRINAGGHGLGKVSVSGDLAAIDAGVTGSFSLERLSVRSMGLFGLATQNGAGDLVSDIFGRIGALVVATDIQGAFLNVEAGANGEIGSIIIGGSLVGEAAVNSGSIISSGDIGPLKIGHDIEGGSGDRSGQIRARGALGTVTLGGSLVGGAGNNSGELLSDGDMGAVTIAHNLVGRLGVGSGLIGAGTIKSLTIGGSMLGGEGDFSGSVFTTSDLGPVSVKHNIKGGSGNVSGKLDSLGAIVSLTVGGSLIGGAGDENTFSDGNGISHSGQVFAISKIGPVKIGHDVQGDAGDYSGTIHAGGNLVSVRISGSLVGEVGFVSGRLLTEGTSGPITIGHDMVGGRGTVSGGISVGQTLGAISIGGSVIGGSGDFGGSILSGDVTGGIRVGHDILGGTASGSGSLTVEGKLSNLQIGGSLIGGTGSDSGSVLVSELGLVNIGHDLAGGSIAGTTATLDSSGLIRSSQHIAGVTIGGSIIAGIDSSSVGELLNNASIRAGGSLGFLSVKGGLIGNVSPTGNSMVIVSALAQTGSNLAIGKITIGDRVEFAKILAGFVPTLAALNGDAQIGPVSVGGDWASSSLVAGVENLGADDAPGGTGANADNVNFGDLHDRLITGGTLSKIASITVAGQVFGTPDSFSNSVNHFGFVAGEIDSLKVGGRSIALNAGPGNDGFVLGRMLNMTLHEADSLIGSTLPGVVPAAKLLNGSTLTYTDVDGDFVTVKLSRPLLTVANVDRVFQFDRGSVTGGEAEPRQLQVLDLSNLATSGLSVTLSVKAHGRLSDGLVNVGYLNSTGFNLGSVIVQGDLGRIDAGTSTLGDTGLRALNVRTLGRLSVDTQPAASMMFVPSLESTIQGDVGSLSVKADVVDVSFQAREALGNVSIGGSLIGENGASSGVVVAVSTVGPVKIGAHLQGGAGLVSGQIYSGVKIVAVTVGGSLIGGAGMLSGRLVTIGDIGPVKIAHNLLGGTLDQSGNIAGVNLGAITIGGSILGGAGFFSGNLTSYSGDIGVVTIGHSIRAGAATGSGKIDAGTQLLGLKVGGSLIGSAGDQATKDMNNVSRYGQVFAAGRIGPISIGHDLVGGSALYSGIVRSLSSIGNVNVGGSIIGGSNLDCGGIEALGNLGTVKVNHDVHGSSGNVSGFINGRGTIAGITIGGSLVGGSNSTTGALFSAGSIARVSIGQDVLGGSDSFSGYVQAGSKVGAVKIAGSVIGGTATVTGRLFAFEFGSVSLGHDLIGGSLLGNGFVDSTGELLSLGRIGSVSIGGSVISGIDSSAPGFILRNGTIRAGADIGVLSVRGSLIGNAGPNGISVVLISALGQSGPEAGNDVAIGKLSVGGRVERVLVLAGYDPGVNVFNSAPSALDGNAQIGAVSVGGDWIASSLVAGVADTANNGFGNADDSFINIVAAARIASVRIAGTVAGTTAPGDHFGFVAPAIGLFESAGLTVRFTPNNAAPVELSLVTGDVTVRQI